VSSALEWHWAEAAHAAITGREPIRCYFLRANRIEAVELLQPAPDADLIQQAKEFFSKQSGMDHFEVWEGRRFVYRSERAKREPPAQARALTRAPAAGCLSSPVESGSVWISRTNSASYDPLMMRRFFG